MAPDWTDSLYDLGLLVSERSGKRVPVLVASDGLGAEYSADNSRLRNEMRDLRFTPPEIAIDGLFRWYEDRRSEIDASRLETDR